MSSSSDLCSERKWSCDYCTYENFKASKKCTMCRAPRRPQYIDTDETRRGENDIYKMASLVQPEPVSSTGREVTPVDGWACRMCTFVNNSKAANCVQCLTTRGPPPRLGASQQDSQIPLSINTNDITHSATKRNSPNSPEAAKAANNGKNKVTQDKAVKWACKACTYDNWPKSMKCVICGVAKSRSTELLVPSNIPSPRDSTASSCVQGARAQSESASDSGATASCVSEGTSSNELDNKKQLRQIRNRLRDIDWLFLTACQAVVDGESNAVEAYVASGGDARRQLTMEECLLLGRPSAFMAGYTLVHLAVRFQREDVLALLLTLADNASTLRARKRTPAYVAPDIAAEIMGEISRSIRQRKGDFPCYFSIDLSTFALPAEIDDFPNSVRKQLFDELLDRNAQKELEDEERVINWSCELTDRLGSRLYPLWNRTGGDCLLDSLLQVTWGVMDGDNILRRALADSLQEGGKMFFPRFKFTESLQAALLDFSIEERQFERDWAYLLALANKPGTALEQIHVFACAHILRRPIIIYGIKYIKSVSGENIGFAKFQGVYLPLLWERSFCWKTPVALGYTRGHFNALVPQEIDLYGGAGAHSNNCEDGPPTAYLPLVDCEGKPLPVHFLQPSEMENEQDLLHEWLECCVTEGGILVAKQPLTRPSPLLHQMLDEWLHRYRRLTHVVNQSSDPVGGEGRGQSPVRGGANVSSEEESDDE